MPTARTTFKDNNHNREEVQDTTLCVCRRWVSGNKSKPTGFLSCGIVPQKLMVKYCNTAGYGIESVKVAMVDF
jgi:hypothetical protein